jgi:MerR family transcriptional regulator, mercuric resistance operon regulatory protein
MDETYSIGAFAEACGVGVETVRYYERRRLLAQPPRRHGSIRRYGAAELGRLRFIRRAQAAGFTLDEVEALIRFQKKRSCDDTKKLASAKLREIDFRVAELQRLREELGEWVVQCDLNQEEGCCPVLDALDSK